MLNLIYFTADGRFNKEACAVINDLIRQGKLKGNLLTDILCSKMLKFQPTKKQMM